MKKRIRTFWTRARPLLPVLAGWLGLYLDDLLLIAAGACFTAGRAFGASAALAVAGACCLGYGVIVARSRRGGGG